MRIRTIKPEWLEDDKISSASLAARTLSVALLLLADDHGRGRASVIYLQRMAMPAESDDTVARARDELVAVGFVELYRVRGQEYFEVRNWSRHQRVDRPGKPRVPAPEREPRETHANIRDTHAKDRETHANPRDTHASERDYSENENPRDTHANIRGTHATDHDHFRDHRPQGGVAGGGADEDLPTRVVTPEPPVSPEVAELCRHVATHPELACVAYPAPVVARFTSGIATGTASVESLKRSIDAAASSVRKAQAVDGAAGVNPARVVGLLESALKRTAERERKEREQARLAQSTGEPSKVFDANDMQSVLYQKGVI